MKREEGGLGRMMPQRRKQQTRSSASQYNTRQGERDVSGADKTQPRENEEQGNAPSLAMKVCRTGRRKVMNTTRYKKSITYNQIGRKWGT